MDISAREPTPGEALYRQWCGSEISDRARYFTRMNPADKRAWERLASEVVSDDVDYWRRAALHAYRARDAACREMAKLREELRIAQSKVGTT